LSDANLHDPFLHQLYDRLHDSPMQQKLRRLAPMPAGVVYVQPPEHGEEEIRAEFRTIKSLGFNCLKGLYVLPGVDITRVEHIALDEGLIPYYYGEGGYEALTDELLTRLGIDTNSSIEQIRTHKAFIEHQRKVIAARIDRRAVSPEVPSDGRPRFPFSFDAIITEESAEHFAEWLRQQYGTVDALSLAWNMNRTLINRPEPMWTTWADVKTHCVKQCQQTQEYRRLRDVLRYKADVYLGMVQERAANVMRFDPNAPARAGGEMGLFLPFASRATDMEGVAEAMRYAGSFYPSIHLAWHFEEVGFEVARPVYMQSSVAVDWFKGGWSATWESTGGPQQLSGGKAHLYPKASPQTAGFSVDGGVMRQLILSYFAAGFRGFGLWCWNPRTAGWEAGEYALVDRQGRPTDRAIEAGRLGAAANVWRDELWTSHKEPLVGVYNDFDNDAMWAVIAIGGREHFKHYPVEARIGAARAFINGNVPFEYVTGIDLDMGLAMRYSVIYLASTIAISYDRLELLREYVQNGGRLVIDLPGGWYDDYGRMMNTARGSIFEQIFGVTIRDFQYSQSANRVRKIGVKPLDGLVADLEVTTARVVDTYDTGAPAITENRLGNGTAVVLGYEAARLCHKPGDDRLERWLRDYCVGAMEHPFACDGAIVYRRAGAIADHYFFINDGHDKLVKLDPKKMSYAKWIDAVTQEAVDPNRIELPGHSGRWLRAVR
jgi:beta-galactosidase